MKENLYLCTKCGEYIKHKDRCDRDDCDFFMLLVWIYIKL